MLIEGITIGMDINMLKSTILFNEVDEVQKSKVINIIPINYYDIDHGIKYSSFNLKSNEYKFVN